MRIFLATFGSLGDVQPFIWLGRTLQRQGHDILLIANSHFQAAIEGAGLAFRPAGTEEDYQEASRPAQPAGSRFRDQGEQIAAARRLFTCLFWNPVEATCRTICDRASPDSLVIGHNFAYGARLAAELRGIPFLNVPLSTYWLQAFRQPSNWREAWVKRMTALNTRFIDGQLFSKPFNALRRTAGLDPLSVSSSRYMQSNLNLCLFPDWWLDFPLEPELKIVKIGFPADPSELASSESLPSNLAEFIQRCGPPLVFTPGSAARDCGPFFQAALATLRQTSRPGVFLTRDLAALPPDLPDQVFPADFVPLAPLLRHSAGLIHHGGIGTLTQGLRAGIPQLVCHRLAEQQENARQLIRLGVGRALPYAGITGEAMGACWRELFEDENVPAACRNVQERLLADSRQRPAALALAEVVAQAMHQ